MMHAYIDYSKVLMLYLMKLCSCIFDEIVRVLEKLIVQLQFSDEYLRHILAGISFRY